MILAVLKEVLTKDREVADILESPWKPKHEAHNHSHNTEHDRTSTMIRHSIHGHRKGQHVCAHDEKEDQDLTHGENLSSDWPKHEHATVSVRLNRWMSQLEFPDYVSCIRGDQAQKTDTKKTGDETENRESLRERENTERNIFREHENARMPPERVSMKAHCKGSMIDLPLARLVVDLCALFITEDVVIDGGRDDLAFWVGCSCDIKLALLVFLHGIFI